jgi:hypothetical protein
MSRKSSGQSKSPSIQTPPFLSTGTQKFWNGLASLGLLVGPSANPSRGVSPFPSRRKYSAYIFPVSALNLGLLAPSPPLTGMSSDDLPITFGGGDGKLLTVSDGLVRLPVTTSCSTMTTIQTPTFSSLPSIGVQWIQRGFPSMLVR